MLSYKDIGKLLNFKNAVFMGKSWYKFLIGKAAFEKKEILRIFLKFREKTV